MDKSRFQLQQEERDAHRDSLEQKYGVVGHRKAELLYDLAWEYGHAYGFSEVELFYQSLVTLIQD